MTASTGVMETGTALDYGDETATLGDRLTAAREAAGMGLAELAARLGIVEAWLSDWEENRSEPRANRLQMLAGMLDVSLAWLMSGEGDGPRAGGGGAAALADCVRELRALSAEQARTAERLDRLGRRLSELAR